MENKHRKKIVNNDKYILVYDFKILWKMNINQNPLRETF